MIARFHRRVRADLNEILGKCDAISDDLGDDFFVEFQLGIQKACSNPRFYHFDASGLRRCNPDLPKCVKIFPTAVNSRPTGKTRSSPLLVPANGFESFDGIEVFVPCCQREIMDKAGGGDPAIVFGNNGTHFRKPGLHHAVAFGNLVVQMHGLR